MNRGTWSDFAKQMESGMELHLIALVSVYFHYSRKLQKMNLLSFEL